MHIGGISRLRFLLLVLLQIQSFVTSGSKPLVAAAAAATQRPQPNADDEQRGPQARADPDARRRTGRQAFAEQR